MGSNTIERYAVDVRGKPGLFYNASVDEVIVVTKDNAPIEPIPIDQEPQCDIINGDGITLDRLMQWIGIEDELRLSLFLSRRADPRGIARIVKHPRPFDQSTRIVYYSWHRKRATYSSNSRKMDLLRSCSSYPPEATHQIISVTYGIAFIAVLQLPSEMQCATNIDQNLQQIIELLRKRSDSEQVFQKQQKLFQHVPHYEVYSNVPHLRVDKCFSDLLQQAQTTTRISDEEIYPIKYTLEPLRFFNLLSLRMCPTYYSLDSDVVQTLLSEINEYEELLRRLAFPDNNVLEASFGDHLQKPFEETRSKYATLKKTYSEIRKELLKLVIDARDDPKRTPVIRQYLSGPAIKQLQHSAAEATLSDRDLLEKCYLIVDLQKSGIVYEDVSQYSLPENMDPNLFVRQPMEHDPHQIFLCSSDCWRKKSSPKWTAALQKVIQLKRQDQTVRVTYLDFTYSRTRLSDIMILPSSHKIPSSSTIANGTCQCLSPSLYPTNAGDLPAARSNPTHPSASCSPSSLGSPPLFNASVGVTEVVHQKNKKTEDPSKSKSSMIKPQSQHNSSMGAKDYAIQATSPSNALSPMLPIADSSSRVEPINILLVGQSGVGKSTFINAIANYLNFASLEDALKGEPIVLIPVSFMITTGYNFDEKIVTFDRCNNADNEHFNNSGHSVTQHCQEYIFQVGENGGQRIRLIDTPGFGDTRGVDKDQENIDHIKKYIKHYASVDVVCFLLKPNESRLNIALRSSLAQFAAVLREAAYENLLFCFTNARSTFYAPGNTGPLIKKLLTDWQMNHIKLEKQNTFCFDNESFRYLVARKNGIQFEAEEHEDYKKSWEVSVHQAKRLLKFVVQKAMKVSKPSSNSSDTFSSSYGSF